MSVGPRRATFSLLLAVGWLMAVSCAINPQPEPPGSSDLSGGGGSGGARDAGTSGGSGGLDGAGQSGAAGTAGGTNWDAAVSGDADPSNVPDADGGGEVSDADAEVDADVDAEVDADVDAEVDADVDADLDAGDV